MMIQRIFHLIYLSNQFHMKHPNHKQSIPYLYTYFPRIYHSAYFHLQPNYIPSIINPNIQLNLNNKPTRWNNRTQETLIPQNQIPQKHKWNHRNLLSKIPHRWKRECFKPVNPSLESFRNALNNHEQYSTYPPLYIHRCVSEKKSSKNDWNASTVRWDEVTDK